MAEQLSKKLKNTIRATEDGMESQMESRELAAQLTFPGSMNKDEVHDLEAEHFINEPTTVLAVERLINNIIRFQFPNNSKWVILTTSEMINHPTRKSTVYTTLESVGEDIWRMINNSSFGTVRRLFIRDMIVQGAGCLYMSYDNVNRRLGFEHLATDEISFKYNKHYVADTVVICYKKTVKELLTIHSPQKLNSVGINTDEDKLEEEVELKKLIVPELPDSETHGYNIYEIYEDYILNKLLKHPINPYIITPWDMADNHQKFGTSPVRNLLGSIIYLHSINHTHLESANYRASPPLTTPDPVDRNQINLLPGEILQMDNPPVPINFTNGQLPLTYRDVDTLRQQIKEGMYWFQPPIEGAAHITATQSSQIERAFLDNISVSILNIERTMVKPIINNIMKMLIMNNDLPTDKIMLDRDGRIKWMIDYEGKRKDEITIRATSGVKQSADRNEALQTMETLQQLHPFIESLTQTISQESGMVIKYDELIHDAASKLGIPMKFLRDSEERSEEISKLQQQAVQDAQVEGAAQSEYNNMTGEVPGANEIQ